MGRDGRRPARTERLSRALRWLVAAGLGFAVFELGFPAARAVIAARLPAVHDYAHSPAELVLGALWLAWAMGLAAYVGCVLAWRAGEVERGAEDGSGIAVRPVTIRPTAVLAEATAAAPGRAAAVALRAAVALPWSTGAAALGVMGARSPAPRVAAAVAGLMLGVAAWLWLRLVLAEAFARGGAFDRLGASWRATRGRWALAAGLTALAWLPAAWESSAVRAHGDAGGDWEAVAAWASRLAWAPYAAYDRPRAPATAIEWAAAGGRWMVLPAYLGLIARAGAARRR